MLFRAKTLTEQIQQMRLNPQNVQNVVTYNVVIDVNNPEQKLKPGMTANLIITIDERNNVLKVPNAALRFMPQDGTRQRTGQWHQDKRQGSGPVLAAGNVAEQQDGNASGGSGFGR